MRYFYYLEHERMTWTGWTEADSQANALDHAIQEAGRAGNYRALIAPTAGGAVITELQVDVKSVVHVTQAAS